MSGFKASNGWEFTPSDDFDGVDLESHVGGGGTYWGVGYVILEVLWRYFQDPDAVIAEGLVERWTTEAKEWYSEASGVRLFATYRGETINVILREAHVVAFRELYDWLDGESPSTIWERRPAAVALAMLHVGNGEDQVQAIWNDEPQRKLWTDRAKAVLTHVSKHF